MARTRTRRGNAESATDVQPVRVAAYIRVSTDEQAESGLGLGDQRVRCAAMASVKGWPEPTFYADEGISGTKDARQRPALARLLADVRAGQVDAVIIRDLSRLGRKTRIILDLVEELTAHGVALVSTKESLDTTTATGQFVLTLFAALAQLERDQIAERTKGALDERGRRDGEKGGRIPYGYQRTERGVRVDPQAAATVRRIFDMRRRGATLREIATKLNAAGIVGPRGARWHHSSVQSVLANRAAYLGAMRGASSIPWPAILGKRATAA